jgi:hypothetical protein
MLLFKIDRYRVEDELKVPERPSFVEGETLKDALDLAKRALGVERTSDMALSQFIGKVPSNAKVYVKHMTFEELHDLELSTAL